MDEAQESATGERWRVLVVVLNSLRDLEVAREEGWYRIPLKRAPTRIGADYLAFYQTSVFGDERWAVNYYAPVMRYRIVPRRILLPQEVDHPRADDLYYRIQIGLLRRLARAIPSRRLRRITFIPTTLERLLAAEEINDLWCGTRDEEQLWRAFKEHGLAPERRYPLAEGEEQRTADFALFCKDGRLAVCLESEPDVRNVRVIREHPLISEYEAHALGWSALRLENHDIVAPAANVMQTIMQAAGRLGGLTPPPASEGP